MNRNKLKIWFNQLICRHEWHPVGEMCRFTIREDGVPVECLSEEVQCVRCGRRKTEFIKMSGRFI